ncbi:MAG: chemotaxis response regulator protein-glutamate methylesterase [Pirellulales bacterium]|nr:chemotaxis response regulator protein-glutamate methylesterase [Pirellulales bacterium]
MSDKQTRVMVVDDSALIREMISDLVDSHPKLEVAGCARDGLEAVKKVDEFNPDVITLDIQMPRMDGLESLDAILSKRSIPVIMVSSLTQRAADVTLDALQRGAMDYVAKPESIRDATGVWGKDLLNKIQNMAGADVNRILRIRKSKQKKKTEQTASCRTAAPVVSAHPSYVNCCIALGISTGGPPALSRVFESIEPPLPPLVVVQHMPAQFTGPFAKRLDLISRLNVKEAETGDVLKPNHAYVAPGGKHLVLRRRGSNVSVAIRNGDPVSGHKPSVDVMMQSAVDCYGQRVLGVIMTGMGHDGADGCGAIKQAGGYVFGQDEATSDVYGMNKVAFVAGNVHKQFDLDSLPRLITKQCSRQFTNSKRISTN